MNIQTPNDCNIQYTLLPDASAILVTGSTGFLGAYLLAELSAATNADIYCLVRAQNEAEGRERIYRNLESYSLDAKKIIERVRIVCGDVSKFRLGMSDDNWRRLSDRVAVIFHGAAKISWLDSFKKLEPTNVVGTRNILKFAHEVRNKTLHFVSTTGIYMSLDAPALGYLNKRQPLEKYHRHVIGYFKSKWIAEQEIQKAFAGGLTGTIYRPSFILGTMNSGYTPPGDLTRLFLSACLEVKAVPDLELFVDAVPVDVVARAIVNVASRPNQNGREFNLSQPGNVTLAQIAHLSQGFSTQLELLSFEAWQDLLREAPMTEAKRIMILFGWPVPGAPLGLMSLFSDVRLDLGNVDIEDALQGSGMASPGHCRDSLASYLTDIIEKSTPVTEKQPV